VGTDSLVTVYNYRTPTHTGPCYRCVYPSPPPDNGCNSCSDAGVLGPVVGLAGTRQALETVKVLLGLDPAEHGVLSGTVAVFDACYGVGRDVRVRGEGGDYRKKTCQVCGENPTIRTPEESAAVCAGYVGPTPPDDGSASSAPPSGEEVTAAAAADMLGRAVLLDVREANQVRAGRLSVRVRENSLRKRSRLGRLKEEASPVLGPPSARSRGALLALALLVAPLTTPR
jgi:adenylyltransferase/sulfurtransferase